MLLMTKSLLILYSTQSNSFFSTIRGSFFCLRASNFAIEAHQILISRKKFQKSLGTTIMYDISKIPKNEIS